MFAINSKEIVKRSLFIGRQLTLEIGYLNRGHRNRFIIPKDNRNSETPYTLRCQSEAVSSEIRTPHISFTTTFTTVIDLSQPNAVSFYNIVEQDLAHNSYDLTNNSPSPKVDQP